MTTDNNFNSTGSQGGFTFATGSTSINLDNFDFTTTTSGTFTLNPWGGEITIESFEFKQTDDGNFIEVVKREKPNLNFYAATWPPQEQKDRVFKEIYGVTTEDGRQILKLLQTIEGDVTPGYYVDESISFDE